MRELGLEDLKAVSGGFVLPSPGTPPVAPRLPIADPYPSWRTSTDP
jgi:hypothetical protein